MSMTVEQRAIASILDVVEELAAKVGDSEWADAVKECFDGHRRELRTGEVDEEDEDDRPRLALVQPTGPLVRRDIKPGMRKVDGRWFYSAGWL
jgi:hypothetical protein